MNIELIDFSFVQLQHCGQLCEVLLAVESDGLESAGEGANQRRNMHLRVLQRQCLELALLLKREPSVASLRHARKAAMLTLPHRRVGHAVVYVAVELSCLASFEQELYDLEAVSFIYRPVIALHAEKLEDQVWSLFSERVVKAREIKFVQVRFFDDQADASTVVPLRKVGNEHGQLLAKGRGQGLSCDDQVFDDTKDVPETCCLAKELSLSIALTSDVNSVGLSFGSLCRVDE